MTHHINEALEYTALNTANVLFLLATFRWDAFIPAPDRVVEWSVGLLVGVTLVAVNLLKIYRLYKNKKTDD